MRHPEEGEIHAWLDGALASDESAGIEAHVARCARCAAEVATARGLIAGASRILLALDSVPGGVIPARADASAPSPQAPTTTDIVPGDDLSFAPTKATRRRQTPWFSRPLTRVAAGLVLAVGIGTVAVREGADRPASVVVELRTEAPSTAAPELSSAPAPVAPAATGAAVQEAGGIADAAPARLPAPRRAAGTLVGDASTAPPVPAAVRERTATDVAAASPPPPPPSAVADAFAGGAASGTAQRNQAADAPRQTGLPGSRVSATAPAGAGRGAETQAGGATASAAAASQARLDSAALRRSSLRLSNVVVTGAATAPRDSLVGGGLGFLAAASRKAAADSLAGACFALELQAPAAGVQSDLLPRTIRIRLADLQNVATEAARAEARGTDLQGDLGMRRALARSAQPQPPAPPAVPEPLETVEWESVAGDSVVARRLTGIDVIVFRLFISGDAVRGTAAAQTAITSPVGLSGRRISCDGSGF